MENEQNNPNQLVRVQNRAQVPGLYYPTIEKTKTYPHALDDDEQVHLLDYWRVLVKRRWTILTFVLIVMIVAGIATWKATPIYRATIKLQIDPEQTNVLPFKETAEPVGSYAQSQEYLQTQFKVLESQTLAARVIRALNLQNNAQFVGDVKPTVSSSAIAWLRALLASRAKKEDDYNDDTSVEDRKFAGLVRSFGQNLTTTPIRNSRIVHVNFDARQPRLAADVVNTLANEYIQMNFETKFNATTTASDFLAKQLVDLKAKVEKSEEELVRFSQQHNIYAISEKENVILQKLADLNSALTAVQADRIQKESVWNIVHQSGRDNFPEVLRNMLIKELETNLARLRQEEAKLGAAFKAGWPELDKVTGQLIEAEKQLAVERQRAIQNVETEYRTAVQREKLLTEALNAQKIEANAFNQDSIYYNIIKRQVDTDKQLYEGLLQRMKEAGVSAGLKSNNIHVVDPASPPRNPFKPNKTLNMSIALIVGLMLGIGLAFFIEYLDSSIKTPDDIDRFIKLPSLGVIPSLASFASSPERKLLAAAAQGNNGSKGSNGLKSVELITHHDTKSLISEAYRNLRTSVLLSSGAGRPPKLLLVTSSQIGEGKTTTAINAAITLAQTGDKVVLIDCDMRNPRVHRALGLENTNGMSGFLSGNSDLSSLIQQSDVPNLFAVSAGRIPPNPAELIGSARMKQGLALLDEYFDHVVIDSPPVLSVTDARILATMVDGVILVIKGGETPKEAVQRTKRLLQDVHAHIIGTLLNNVDVHSADYYYYSKYYYYGYGRKYGYGYGAEAQQSEKTPEAPLSGHE